MNGSISQLLLPAQYVVLVHALVGFNAGIYFPIRPGGPDHDFAVKLEVIRIIWCKTRTDQTKETNGAIPILGNILSAINRIFALIVVTQIHADDVRIAPRVAIDAGVVHAAGRLRVVRRGVVAGYFSIEILHLLRIFDVEVVQSRYAVAISLQIHKDGNDLVIGQVITR